MRLEKRPELAAVFKSLPLSRDLKNLLQKLKRFLVDFTPSDSRGVWPPKVTGYLQDVRR
jgi:hypothetical protein